MGWEIANNVISAILDLSNTKLVQVFYHLRLFTADPDESLRSKNDEDFIIGQTVEIEDALVN